MTTYTTYIAQLIFVTFMVVVTAVIYIDTDYAHLLAEVTLIPLAIGMVGTCIVHGLAMVYGHWSDQ